MRIVWLDVELTEAILIRGHFWWKRKALVRRRTTIELTSPGCERPDVHWCFSYSEIPAVTMSPQLEWERGRQLQNGLDDVDWIRAREMPRPSKKKLKQPTQMRLLP